MAAQILIHGHPPNSNKNKRKEERSDNKFLSFSFLLHPGLVNNHRLRGRLCLVQDLEEEKE